MIKLKVLDETAPLESVVLGLPGDFGGTPKIEDAYDPKSKWHIEQGTYPTEAAVTGEMNQFLEVLQKHGVKVYRPENIPGLNQIFSRDIGFVIGEKFVVSRILEKRKREQEGIKFLLEDIGEKNLIRVPAPARIEGGDVMPVGDHIFVGYSDQSDFDTYVVSRTNPAGLDFMVHTFDDWEVKGFELNKSDIDPRQNALHLDCCFQPIGRDMAILFEGGFKNAADVEFIRNYYGSENVLEIDREQMYNMCSNVFSISPDVIVSEKGFTKLNSKLRDYGFTVEEINYAEIGKMEGLLRCSTLPLKRRYV